MLLKQILSAYIQYLLYKVTRGGLIFLCHAVYKFYRFSDTFQVCVAYIMNLGRFFVWVQLKGAIAIYTNEPDYDKKVKYSKSPILYTV